MSAAAQTSKPASPSAVADSATALEFEVQPIKLRHPDGSIIVQAGRPQAVSNEVSITQFSKATGVSKRHILTLCEQGFIKHRRLTGKPRSKVLIARTEIARFRSLSGESPTPPKTPAGESAPGLDPATGKNAAYPGARRGRLIIRGQPTTKKQDL